MDYIRKNERVAFVGKTGSGKTFAARLLTAPIERLVVFDSKGTLKDDETWNLEEWNKRTAKRLKQGKPIRVRIPTPISGYWEPYFKTCYDAEDCTIYIDELYGVLGARRAPGQYLTALYTRGRELGIGVWAATQRPTWVPLFALSESDWIYVFRLQLDTDKKRMAEIIGEQARRELKDHQVLVFHQSWEQPRYYARIQAKDSRKLKQSTIGKTA
jgi:ABC-type dipeptide/oligopeptide/nickel transport system ATPase component